MADNKKCKKKWPSKWAQIYPVGTQEGDEEARFFRALARHPKYDWRSTSAIGKEAKLTKERVEEILNKYYKKGMIFQNPANEDQWGYWERVPQMVPCCQKSLAKKDQDDRIDKALKFSDVWRRCPGVPTKNENLYLMRDAKSVTTFKRNSDCKHPTVERYRNSLHQGLIGFWGGNTFVVDKLKKELGLKTADEL